MATTNLQRQHMIRQAVLQAPGPVLVTTLQLWQSLSQELISIIGEGGFHSMYVRSLHLAADRYSFLPRPPLATSSTLPPDRFGSLIASLQACSSAPGAGLTGLANAPANEQANQLPNDLAIEASIALFCIFIDTLALLIGEHLTSSILRSAWGNTALDPVEKETHQ